MEFTVDRSVLLFSALLVIGVFTTKFSSRLGVPSLVFFIAVGMILSRFIYYDSAFLTQLFGVLALIVILFEGGLQTKWSSTRKVIIPSVTLATVGVFITTAIIGVLAKYILGVSWLEGLLFGAIVGSTDAAAVFAVLGNKNIKPRLTSTLEAESGTNDPMAIFLTVALIELIMQPDTSVWSMVLGLFWQMGLGLAAGLLFGKASVWIINKINLDSSGLYPVLSMALAILTYSVTALLQGSGLLAVYVMAVLVGNSDLTYRHSIFRFNEGFAWMMQILMFILLGLLVFPNQLIHIVWQGLALSLLLMFVARPIGVFISLRFLNFNLKEITFISWAGLRGAVPIVLATYPMMAGLEGSQLLFNVVFFVVLTSALIQGATITPLANKLGLSGGKKVSVPHSLELVSMGQTNSEIIEIVVEPGSRVAGKELRESQIPHVALINAIVREGKIITPRGQTLLLEDDILYILLPKTRREEIKAFFRTVPVPEAAAEKKRK
ncbi:potassium/proton antiporter [Paenibacillus sp. F411]|uniref:Cell volume regulation protein A n=1 Tax=Paenibacillus algicola TaxID=2565926 RepID=A0A4P8XH14_9BACL|nr:MULTISPECIES: potassium/proton antiporter [Paenibacillus]MBO2944077.1 potassium/proton antiporter [Paenibacillus sp. F411]QCT01817.1 cell volume regulation protein A [Paenibacillus algicola]